MTGELAAITGPGTALVAGLITSLHCAGMCGPLACALMPARATDADPHLVGTVYHLCRLAGYTVLGALAGVQQTGFGAPVTLPAMGEQVSPLVLTVDRKTYPGPFHFTVVVQDAAGTYQLSRAVEFMGPEPKLLEEEDRENGIKR
jgi:hypothetical protein